MTDAERERRRTLDDDRAAQGLLDVLWAIRAHLSGDTPIGSR